jgi:hypothetical protein
MDMTTIDGGCVSKYSIKAIKISKKASAQMRAEFEKFNAEHVGEDSVFPTKNGAPKILEQFKDKPYTLELRDEFTTGNKPKSLIANNQGNTLSWQTRHMQGARALRSHHTSG